MLDLRKIELYLAQYLALNGSESMKTIYLVRHCKAAGQEPNAPLTEQGQADAVRLQEFFEDKNIEVIISSPFIRAMDTIKPFAEARGIRTLVDDRLMERVLCSTEMTGWMEKLEETYLDLDLRYEGGETSNEAMKRGVAVIEELKERDANHIIIVTHGALLSLILKNYDKEIGFNEWKGLTNPDVYVLELTEDQAEVMHCWECWTNLR